MKFIPKVISRFNGTCNNYILTIIHFNFFKKNPVKVLYDYESQSPEELTIKEGDVIQVTNKEVAEGWWEGMDLFLLQDILIF